MMQAASAKVLIVWVALVLWRVGAQELDCSFRDEPLSLMDGLMTLQHIVNPQEGTIKIELIYDDIGWVSFGTHPNGKMTGGEAVIALTAEDPSDTNPGKYIMYGEEEEDILLMNKQSLLDASFEQTDKGQTILRFTKLLSEEDELEIDPDGSNTFIFAAGSENEFGDHGRLYGRTTLDVLAKCRVLDTSNSAPTDNSQGNDEDTPENIVGGTTDEGGDEDGDDGKENDEDTAENIVGGTTDEDGDEDTEEDGDDGKETDNGGNASEENDGDDGGSSSGSGNMTPIDNNAGDTVVVGGLDCSFRNEITLMEGLMTLKQIVNPDEETITIEVTYNDEGWVSFGISPNGKMIGGEVVIAMTSDSQSATNPGKYIMTGETTASISLMERQTLLNASFEQTNGKTVLRYTKLLKESDETEIVSGASNTFIFAAGSDNNFGDHGPLRGRITLDSLTMCRAADGSSNTATDDGDVEVISESESGDSMYRNLWVSHGILMGISWAVLLPIAIGCSLLRKLIPSQGLWYKLHMYINGTAFLLMTAAFGIAVYIIDQEGDEHFEGRHQAVGLAVYLMSFLQILVGIFRPPLPRHDADKLPEDKVSDSIVETTLVGEEEKQSSAVSSVYTDEVEQQVEQPSPDSSISHVEAPKEKSLARIAFEVGHRILGCGLLGLAWYACYTGIMELVQSYGESYDKTSALWGVVVGLSGSILLVYAYQVFKMKAGR